MWKGHLYSSNANMECAKRELKQPKKMLSHVISGLQSKGALITILLPSLISLYGRRWRELEVRGCTAEPLQVVPPLPASTKRRCNQDREHVQVNWEKVQVKVWAGPFAYSWLRTIFDSLTLMTLCHPVCMCCLSHPVLFPFPLSGCQHVKTPWQGQCQSATLRMTVATWIQISSPWRFMQAERPAQSCWELWGAREVQRLRRGWQMEWRTCSLHRASCWQLCGELHTHLSVGAKCYPSRMGAVCTPLFTLVVPDSMSRQDEIEVLNLSRSPLLELYPVWWFCIKQIFSHDISYSHKTCSLEFSSSSCNGYSWFSHGSPSCFWVDRTNRNIFWVAASKQLFVCYILLLVVITHLMCSLFEPPRLDWWEIAAA